MRYSAMSAAQPPTRGAGLRLARPEDPQARYRHADDCRWQPRSQSLIGAGQLDLARGQRSSLTFAPGLHHCIGHLLAKLQLGEFFTALTQRFDRVEFMQEPSSCPTRIPRRQRAQGAVSPARAETAHRVGAIGRAELLAKRRRAASIRRRRSRAAFRRDHRRGGCSSRGVRPRYDAQRDLRRSRGYSTRAHIEP